VLRLEITPAAKADLREIERYTAEKWGEKQASIYLEKVAIAGDRLVQNPTLLGRPRFEIRQGYYSYHFEKHLFIFRITDESIQIVRVLHQSMDLPRHLTETE
jgi:toxin ParE1/3/4